LDERGWSRAFFWGATLAALLLGIARRLTVVGQPGFPMGEGGLFLLFSRLIAEQGLTLSSEAVYGGVTLPFAYPPAAFWMAAWASRVTGLSLEQLYYILPLLLNLLALPAFSFLAAQFTRDRAVFLVAVLLYAQMPESYVWQITGGGLPRALGALAALLAVALALRLAKGARWPVLIGCGLLVGLAVLSHLEWGIFAASGVTLAVLTRGRLQWAMTRVGMIGALALAVVLPWLLLILGRHGLDPFLSSSSASSWSIGMFASMAVSGQLLPGLVAVPALLGLFRSLRERDIFLPLWVPLILLLTPRMGQSAGLAIPAALLAGMGVRELAEIAATAAAGGDGRGWRRVRPLTSFKGGFSAALIAFLAFFSLLLWSPLQREFTAPQVVIQLDEPTRAAMAWAKESTPSNSRFVVISSAHHWWEDRVAEWFPVLAERASLTTAQGLEWAGPGVFTAKLEAIEAFKHVQIGDPALLPATVQRTFCGADHVAVFLPADHAGRHSFAADPEFQLVYQNRAAAAFRRSRPGCGGSA